MKIEVLGAGFGRTGTNSLKIALENIGYGPCYHMYEVANKPDHVDLWNDGIEGRELKVDKIFRNYRSAVDWPSVAFLPSILSKYRDAKVILTMRDSAEWYESASATIFEAMLSSDRIPSAEARKRVSMSRRLVLEQVFNNNYSDKEYCVKIYNEHIENVKNLVPSDQLLMYKINDGWAPLCEFLNVPIPNEPFPVVNDRQSFLAKKPNWAKQS